MEETLQTAIQLYDKVRMTVASRLSFVQSGEHGSQGSDGLTGEPSLLTTPNVNEMLDVTFQRIEHVMRCLVEHSELPDQIAELQLQESSESKLAGIISTSFFIWMLADVAEHFSGGSLATVKPTIENFIQMVGPPSTSQSTSLRSRLPTQNSLSMHIPEPLVVAPLAPALERLADLKSVNGKKRIGGSKRSKRKSPPGKKRPSAKKKSKQSRKRSGGKKRG